MNPEEVREALAWYAAGTLPDEAVADVEAELARSPELRRELQQWQAIRAASLAPRAGEPEFRATPARARALLEQHARDTASPLAEFIDWLRATWFGTPVAGRYALAVQFAVLLAIGAVYEFAPHADASFQTLSGSSQAAHGGARLSVAFEASATEADLRALLSTVGAELVAGPTPEQLYTVELRDRAASPEAALTRLRAAHGVVRFAARDGE